MRERRSTPAYAMLILLLVAGISAQSTRSARADECISKPNSPAPQGQHWYYRIDHANNRQCWRLGPEGLLVRKSAPHADSQLEPSPRAERPITTRLTDAAETASDAAATAAPIPWLGVPKLVNLPPSLQPLPQPSPDAESQSASTIEPAPPVSDNVSTSVSDDGPLVSTRGKKLQRTAARPLGTTAPAQTVVDADHTFALLLIMFASLAVAGLVFYYTKRRRKREVRNFKPPRWAPAVVSNMPAPRVRAPLACGPEIAPAPVPLKPIDQTERLRHALQQVVEQLKTTQRPEPSMVKHSARSMEIEMMKRAR